MKLLWLCFWGTIVVLCLMLATAHLSRVGSAVLILLDLAILAIIFKR